MNVAIIGSGNIGTDLLIKVLKSTSLHCVLFVGRRESSDGLKLAKRNNVKTSAEGFKVVKQYIDRIDLLFDCTGALSHKEHWKFLKNTHVRVIDLTPSNIGKPIIPSVNLHESVAAQNISLVTCGGQGAIPLAYSLTRVLDSIEYLEVVNTIASKSAGPATRDNLDEYLTTTENVIKDLSGVNQAKSILVLNPASPCINMKTTVFAVSNRDYSVKDKAKAEKAVIEMVEMVTKHVPGYQLLVSPHCDKNKMIVTIEVIGEGDYLPSYAGNLDIITAAAISVAEYLSQQQKRVVNG